MNNKPLKELVEEADAIILQLHNIRHYEKIKTYFPDKGPFRRDLYPKALEFFKAGKDHKFRLVMAPNRTGKSFMSKFEFALHLLGAYPVWWVGHRFDKPVNAWAIGQRADTVKDILQTGLLGPVGDFGSEMIPRKAIDFETLTDAKKADTPIGSFRVKHASGGFSTVTFKSYEMGRRSFEGTAIDLILMDEEPPEDVYTECVLRTMTTNGLIIMNFTPLLGMREVLRNFLGGEDWTNGPKGGSRYLVHLDNQNVPHLSDEQKAIMLANIPDFQRKARLQGIPMLSAGNVYPYDETNIFIDPIKIPNHWRKAYAMDFGWKDPTAILWGAVDPDEGTIYFYSEHYQSEQPPMVHAAAIKARNDAAGIKIPGVCDPAGGGRGQHDGQQAREIYAKEYDIHLEPADNSTEPGLQKVRNLFMAGRIKVFNTLTNFKSEYRMYRYDEKGKPTVGAHHLMDCLKYWVATGLDLANATESLDERSQMLIELQQQDAYNQEWRDSPDSWLYNH